jgi:hypothetical protein
VESSITAGETSVMPSCSAAGRSATVGAGSSSPIATPERIEAESSAAAARAGSSSPVGQNAFSSGIVVPAFARASPTSIPRRTARPSAS